MKRLLLTAAAVVAIMLAGTASVRAEQPADLHCPDHNDPAFVKIEDPGDDLVLPEGTYACVKGGQADPTTFVSDGVTTIGEYLPGKWAVSYVVIYREPDPTPTPPPDPTPTPTVEPSPTVPPTKEPIPTPPPTSTAEEEQGGNAIGFLVAALLIAGISLWLNPLIRKV